MHLKEPCPRSCSGRRDRCGDTRRTSPTNDDIRIVMESQLLRGFVKLRGIAIRGRV
jgi:hypothetical protein